MPKDVAMTAYLHIALARPKALSARLDSVRIRTLPIRSDFFHHRFRMSSNQSAEIWYPSTALGLRTQLHCGLLCPITL